MKRKARTSSAPAQAARPGQGAHPRTRPPNHHNRSSRQSAPRPGTSTSTRAPRIALTPGCPAGIGPEVLARALVETTLPRGTRLRFFGSPGVLLLGAKRARVRARFDADAAVVTLTRGARTRVDVEVTLADPGDPGANAIAGKPDEACLRCQRDALVRACVAAGAGNVDAIVTGPVRKEALVVDGEAFPGQTELLHRFLARDDDGPLMVFAGAPFVMGLATVHIALAQVSSALNARLLDVALARLDEAARALLGKRRVRVVVLGVNPHAGEGGMFGRDEIDVVKPAVARARERGLDVVGPVAADGFFADVARGQGRVKGVDAVLAMHHDQGLAPYKLLVGGDGINVTWGLSVPRTSPDHGTADAIAGSGKASWRSMGKAIALAANLAWRASA